ncbi:MAG: BREX-1 system phosphatase PglZ type B [Bacillota bacterium]
MTTTITQSNTMLEAVMDSLARASKHNPGDTVSPVAVLWTDEDRQWNSLVEQLRPLMPALLEYGQYHPTQRKGPSIWLRSVIEPSVRIRAFPELEWPDGTVPVIYMPGVSRQTLRAVEECPDELKPLVELQYRGTVWTQKNGRDWTVLAFLVSQEGGLGLDVAEDRGTLEAMRSALPELSQTPLQSLRNRKLEAADFHRLVVPDHQRALLAWLSAPATTREDWKDERWRVFRSQCREEYSFDPLTDGEIVGAEKLGLREGPWRLLWERFAESPTLYPGIPGLLRKAKPKRLIFDREPWPDENESSEAQLRQALLGLKEKDPSAARDAVMALETEHAPRRSWVWATLGWCPLAQALEYLSVLARGSISPLSGETADGIVSQYTKLGYLCDDAVLRALACAKSDADAQAVGAAVYALYLGWLDGSARALQKCTERSPMPSASQQGPVQSKMGDCLLFVDGLRFDLGCRLAAMTSAAGLESSVAWRWAAFPTVTSTAKPAASPIVASLEGDNLEPDFAPVVVGRGSVLTTERFRKLLEEKGFQVLEGTDTGNPSAPGALAWAECGQLDKTGHDFGAWLASHAEGQLQAVLERVNSLLAAGWKRVQVVTDHGWLLLPGGLPKHDLPKYLTESRWPRFAVIKDGSALQIPVAPWSWNAEHWLSYAPGVCCYKAGEEYAHGGISPQECVIPIVVVQRDQSSQRVDVAVSEVSWRGFRCRIAVEPPVAGLVADLRTKPNVSDSSITTPKALDETGRVSLVVDDSFEGTMVSVVISDASGKIACQRPTIVGEES